jgi:acetyl esterase/lipase
MKSKLMPFLLIVAAFFLTQCSSYVPTVATPSPVVTATPFATSAPLTPTIIPQPTSTPKPTPTLFATPKTASIERDIVYCVADGIVLKLDLYFPNTPSTKPFPVAVNIHGGSWSYGDKTTSETAADIPVLLERGYAISAVNYRFAPAHKFPAQIEDVKCAIRFLRARATQYNLDSQHIGAWGCSAGGHLASLLAVTDPQAQLEGHGGYLDQSSRIQAAAPVSGPSDMTLYDATARGEMLRRVFGITTNTNPILVRASPITYVTKDDPPFLIIQAEKDNIVAPIHAETLYQQLAQVGVPAQLVMVKNAHHCFPPSEQPIEPSREKISALIADFFDRTLRP